MEHTKRQQEVLELIQQGVSNKVIARKLDIAESTVKAHIGELFRAYGFHNRLKLLVYSLEGKELEPPKLNASPLGWVKQKNNRIEGIVFTAIQPYKGWQPIYLKDKE